MTVTNPPFIVTAAVNALTNSTVLAGLGIGSAQLWYGGGTAAAPFYNASTNGVPACLIERTHMQGRRAGFNSGSGSTEYGGTIDITIFLAPTDIGTLETNGDNLIDDLIGQGGVYLNIIRVEVLDCTLPNPEMQPGADAGQPGMATASYCTIALRLEWEG